MFQAHKKPSDKPMQSTYDTQAPKRPANLSINGDLLSKAKALDINLSATLEQALATALRERRRTQWLAENQTAIAAYNDHVEQRGVFSDGLRSF
jgi:antitoxin CcdA